eukprot:gb/GECG01012082.1/.p1 GENE.gb/GECG01012082.1/~~gb/GECG01012082.1/.p1  ORF type:complete len:156 (+),score=5.43 gb/GECG01012082.1/:1-468(+)
MWSSAVVDTTSYTAGKFVVGMGLSLVLLLFTHLRINSAYLLRSLSSPSESLQNSSTLRRTAAQPRTAIGICRLCGRRSGVHLRDGNGNVQFQRNFSSAVAAQFFSPKPGGCKPSGNCYPATPGVPQILLAHVYQGFLPLADGNTSLSKPEYLTLP